MRGEVSERSEWCATNERPESPELRRVSAVLSMEPRLGSSGSMGEE